MLTVFFQSKFYLHIWIRNYTTFTVDYLVRRSFEFELISHVTSAIKKKKSITFWGGLIALIVIKTIVIK